MEGYSIATDDEYPGDDEQYIERNISVCGSYAYNARQILEQYLPDQKEMTDVWNCEIFDWNAGRVLDFYSTGEKLQPSQRRATMIRTKSSASKKQKPQETNLIDGLVEWILDNVEMPMSTLQMYVTIIQNMALFQPEMLDILTDLQKQGYSREQIFNTAWSFLKAGIDQGIEMLDESSDSLDW